jgi:hypothetical protein
MVFVNTRKITNTLLFKAMCFVWLLMKIISWRLWMPERLFPLVPFLEWTNQPEISFILFGFSLVCLVYFSFFTTNNIIIFLFLIFEISHLLLDQMRWQPWEYQFLLTTVFYLFFKKSENFKLLLLTLLAFTYILSGLHKFSAGFLASSWSNIILKRIFRIPFEWRSNNILFYFGYIIPIIEVSLGLLLLKLKK